MSEIRLTPSGQRTLEPFDNKTQERVKDALRKAVEDPERELEILSDYAYHKLRVGDYRALIDWEKEGDDDILWVFAVGHRRNVYDRHLPP
ncbi:type II toxin-antitoxin system RelE/ParE family toxin [Haladaptatus sp. F3-133]|uniref:Type II toxin-antitoxin system RelE/ParE family toxin n=1 Tax=Halorutilus salinus TaxID=2487751 RepID=A0A9Q4C652_9EURY|nr:type II toxin-antitoxin system RelE/ParE family toxin [Halorutilus salinus]MCX2819958.1 type II toxin-antitoxin system RelE/ParE family toxin [Halorutilus salinus]